MTVADVIIRGVKREIDNVVSFLTSPMGPFEALDRIVRDARSTVREVLQTVGVKAPSVAGMRLLR
jgi:3-hydroxyacyl-CoA dehydrogenase